MADQKKIRWLSLRLASMTMETIAHIAESARDNECEVLLDGIDAKDALAIMEADLHDDVEMVIVGEMEDDLLDEIMEVLPLAG